MRPGPRLAIADIETAARHAGDIARQMLAYAGRGQATLAQVNLNTLVQEIQSLLRASLAKDTTIALTLAPTLPLVEADVTQVRQVVLNLIINAAEALPTQRGVIQVTTQVQALAARPATTGQPALLAGNYVTLTVTDTGHGMDAATLQRIFDPFFTTKITGRGLGLSAAQGILRAHRGLLEATSVLGQGSTFTIYLPVSASAAPAAPVAAPPATVAAPPTPPAGLWLVVDDERIVRLTTARLLKFVGYETLEAPDGPTALQLFQENRARCAGVVLDLTMPGQNGHEVFRELRALDPTLPIVVSSGYTEHDASELLSHPHVIFLPKPYEPEALRAAVRAAAR